MAAEGPHSFSSIGLLYNRAMTETLLITGGAGFIASNLADAALAAGHRVLILDSLVGGSRENLPKEAVFLHRDIRDTGLEPVLKAEGVTVVSHHAAQANVRVSLEEPVLDAAINIMGGLELIRACEQAGVRRFLFASSGGTVYGEQSEFPCTEEHPTAPTSPYGCSKLAFEEYLRAYQRLDILDPVILRYANVYGARQNAKGEAGIVAIIAEHLLDGRPPTIFGDGEQTRDYVHVGDVCEIQNRLLERWVPGIYNVGTGVETSVNELYERISRRLASPIEAIHGPPKEGELRRSCLDAFLLEEAIGFRPTTTIEEGLDHTLQYYVDRASESQAKARALRRSLQRDL